MQDWQPDWSDVVFDHAAATDAAAACRATAATIDRALHAERAGRDDATSQWQGALLGRFEEATVRITTDLDELRQDLLALAHRIEAGSDEAAAEQRRRDAERDRWWQQWHLDQRQASAS